MYKHIGRVVGRFYSEAGDRTPELERVEAAAAEAAAGAPQKPPRPAYAACNMQWSVNNGGPRCILMCVMNRALLQEFR